MREPECPQRRWQYQSLHSVGGLGSDSCGFWSLRQSRLRKQEAPELLYIKFTVKEQTSLPALVLKGESRNYFGTTMNFYDYM